MRIMDWSSDVCSSDLLAFCIRRGSGGAGLWPGGNGVIRRIEILEPMTANLLTNRYRTRSFGLAGGGAGEAGQALVRRRDGGSEERRVGKVCVRTCRARGRPHH